MRRIIQATYHIFLNWLHLVMSTILVFFLSFQSVLVLLIISKLGNEEHMRIGSNHCATFIYILTLRHTSTVHIDGLVHRRRNASALEIELCLSCTNPSIYTHACTYTLSTAAHTCSLCIHFLKTVAVYLDIYIFMLITKSTDDARQLYDSDLANDWWLSWFHSSQRTHDALMTQW